MGEIHGSLHFLLVAVRMPNNEVSSDTRPIGAGGNQVINRAHQLMRINFATGAALPIVGVAFETEIKILKACPNHEVSDLGGYETRIKGIGGMKMYWEITLEDSLEERQKDLIRTVKKSIIIEGDVAGTLFHEKL